MSEARAAAAKAKPKTAKGRLIEVRGLDKTFYDADREIRVLRNLDLNVEAGEEIAVVGQSGTGKSTLLHIIGSLEEPTAGKVFFEGEDLFALDEKALAEFRNLKLGFVFQFHYLLADFTALENVMMPALISRIDDAEASGARPRCSKSLAWATSSSAGRRNCPAVSSNASRWRARWCCGPSCCWPTSRPAISIRIRRLRCTTCFTSSIASWGSRW